MRNLPLLIAALTLVGCKLPGGDGCSKDGDCKGDRVCVAGSCTEPAGGGARLGAQAAPAAPGGQAAPGEPGLLQRAAAAVLRGEQVLVDEEVAVSADGWQDRSISLASEREIAVVAEGRKHTDKGFNVYVIGDESFPAFQAKKEFRHVSAFQGLKTRSFGHTGRLPAGRWHVVVVNSENIMNTMVVHLKVTADPK
jgi:hypothetical protein